MTSHSTTRRIAVGAIAGACLVLTALPAAAHHDHHIVTPGTCVADVADGQTSKGAEDPGGHVFHARVHMRTESNGTRVGDLTDGRVVILKTAEMDTELLDTCGL